MTQNNRHIFQAISPSSHRNRGKLTMFQNHPNLLKRDNYPSAKLQKKLESQANIGTEYFSESLSIKDVV